MTRSYISEKPLHAETSAEKRFLQVSLFLPFVFPVLFSAFTFPLYDLKDPTGIPSDLTIWLSMTTLVLGYSLFFGGIPYVVFLVGTFLWMCDKNADQVQRMTLVAPILFVPVFVAAMLALLVVRQFAFPGTTVTQEIVMYILFFCGCVLVLGYVYVLIVNLVYFLFKAVRN